MRKMFVAAFPSGPGTPVAHYSPQQLADFEAYANGVLQIVMASEQGEFMAFVAEARTDMFALLMGGVTKKILQSFEKSETTAWAAQQIIDIIREELDHANQEFLRQLPIDETKWH